MEGKYNTLTAEHDRLKQQAETEKKAAEDKINELEVQRQRLEIENTANQRQILDLKLQIDMHKDAFNELDETHQKLVTGELQWEQQLEADRTAYAELEKGWKRGTVSSSPSIAPSRVSRLRWKI